MPSPRLASPLARLALVAALLLPIGAARASQDTKFAVGSLIVPMDTDYQDAGMLKAFGLVDKLLRAGVPVSWCIKQPKVIVNGQLGQSEADFTASATDYKTLAVINNHGYRGGPFVVDAAQAASAKPVIDAWQKASTTTVHTASAAFTAPVARTLNVSPRVAILIDGYEDIAFKYLNAAGIPDSAGNAWPANAIGGGKAPPDLFTVVEVAGNTVASHSDGKLFRPSGQPGYCAFSAMHFDPTLDAVNTPEAVAEMIGFVQFPTHLNAECAAVRTIEGTSPNGRASLLTPNGIDLNPQIVPPNSFQLLSPFLPVAQLDGAFGGAPSTSAVAAFAPGPGLKYLDNDAILIADGQKGPGFSDTWATAFAFGACPLLGGCPASLAVPRGRVSYLGGHAYTTGTPMSANPSSEGARLWLDALYDSPCTWSEGQPSLIVSMEGPPSTVNAQVTYTLRYKNVGFGAALDAAITDALPNGATFISATGGGVNNNGTVGWTLGDVPPGGSGTVQVTVTFGKAGVYPNSGKVAYTVGNNPLSVTSNTVNTNFNPNGPVLDVVAAAPSSTFSPAVTFTLTYTNSGKSAARAVVLSDALPAGATFVSASNNGTQANGVVTWNLGDLAAGAQGSVTVNVTLTTFGTYPNLATATYGDGSSTFPAISNTTQTVYGALEPQVTLTAAAPQITAVAPITIDFTYANIAAVTAVGTVVSYTLPGSVKFVSATAGGVNSQGTVTWTLGDLAPGATGKLSVNVTLPSYGVYVDQAKATWSDAAQAPFAVASNSATTVYGPNEPDVELVARAPRSVSAAQVTWSIDYANYGNATASSVVVTDTLPVGASMVSATGGGSFANGVVTWNLGALASGASGTLSVTFNLPNPGYYTNSAKAAYSDPAKTALTATSNTTYTTWVTPILLVATAPATTTSADVTFTVTYVNTTAADVTNLVVTDALPMGAKFLGATALGTESKGTVTWTVGKVASGGTGTLAVTLTLPQPGTFPNQFASTYTAGGNNLATPSNTTSTVFTAPALSLVQTGPTGTTVADVTYTLTFANAGPGAAPALTLTETLPAGASFVSASNGGTLANGKVTWTLGDVPAGGSGSVTVTVKLPGPGSYTSACAGSYSAGINPTSVSGNDVTTVWPAAGLNLVASAPATATSAFLALDLTYTNTTGAQVTNLVVSDVLPASTTFVSATGGGTYSNQNNTVSWNVGTVANGASAKLSTTVQLQKTGTFTNTGTATFTSGGQNKNVTSNTTSTVWTGAGLVMTASAPASTMLPTVTFTVLVQNTGITAAQNVVVSDLLPPGTTFVSATAGGALAGGVVTWNAGTIGAGANTSLSVTVDLGLPGVYTNQFSAAATAGGAPLTAASNVTSTTFDGGLLSLTASAPASTPIPAVTFTIAYKNTSNANASNLVITDKLPLGASFVSASGGGTNSLGTVTWNLGSLAAGASGTVTVDVLLTQTGTYLNSGSATATILGSNQAVTSNTTATVYSAPALAVTAGGPATTSVGTVVLTLAYANSGLGTALGVKLTDTLPPGVKVVSLSNGGVNTNGVASWTVGDVAPGGSGVVTATVTLPSPGSYTHTGSGTYTVGNVAQGTAPSSFTTLYNQPTLTLVMTGPATTLNGQATYTITYSNGSASTVEIPVVSYTLPGGAAYVGNTGNGFFSAGVVTWTLANVAAGASGLLSVTVQLPQPGTYSNQASASYAAGLQVLSVQSNVVQTVWPTPSLKLTASAPANTNNPVVTFTVAYQNGGPNPLTGVTLVDPLPAGVTQVTATGGGVYDAKLNTVTWTVGNLAANAMGSVSVTATLPAFGTYTNRATGTYKELAVDQSTASNTTTTQYGTANLAMTVSCPATTSSPTITCTITYKNSGPNQETGLTITDPLPQGAQFVSATGGGLLAGGSVLWNLGTVLPGTSGTLTVTYTLPAPGTYTNLPSASYTEQGAPNLATPPKAASTTYLAPSVTLTASAPATVVVPEATFTLAYLNTGPGDAQAVAITDALPLGASFVGASSGGTFKNGVVTWLVGDLPSGSSGAVTVTVSLAAPGSYKNSGTGTFTVGLAQNQVVSNVTTTSYAAPGVTLVASAPAVTFSPTVTFGVTYSNTAMGTAQKLAITEAAPAGATFVAATGGGTFANNTVTWDVGDVAGGGSGTVFVTWKLGMFGTFTAQASGTFTAGGQQVVSSNTTSTVYQAATIALTASAPASVNTPSATFTLAWQNAGLQAIDNLEVSDKLPPGASFVSASGGGTSVNNVVTWGLGKVAAGAMGSVTVTASLAAPGSYVNQGTAVATTGQLVQTVTSNDTTTVYNTPGLVLTLDGPAVTLGDTITYTIGWLNTGSAPAQNITLSDVLPAGATLVAASNGGKLANGTVTWALPDVPPSGTGAVTLTVKLPAPGTYTDGATAAYSQSGGPATATSNALTTVYLGAGVNLVASAPATVSTPLVTFTLGYSNSTKAVAPGLALIDQLPPGATFVSATGGGTAQNGLVSWTVGDLAAGASGQVSVTASLAARGTYANQGSGTYGTGQAVQSNVTTTEYAAPDLSIELEGPAAIRAPGTATYTIRFVNRGDAPARGVTLSDVLPPGAELVSASNNGMPIPGGVGWSVGDVLPGVGGAVTFTVRYAAPGLYSDRAGAGFTVNGQPQTAQSNVVTIDARAAGLLAVASGPSSTSDPTVTYTITYSNTGNATAPAVTISSPPPAGSTFVSASEGGKLTGGVVAWPAVDLGPGQSGQVQLTVTLPGAGDFLEAPIATYAPAGVALPTPVNTVTTTYVAPTLALTAIAPTTTTLPTVSYSIVYTNTSGVALQNVVVSDLLLPGTTFVSATKGGVSTGGLVTWTLGTVPPGATDTLGAVVSLAAPGTYANSATAAFAPIPGSSGHARSNVTSTEYLGPRVVIETSAPATTPDGLVTYVIKVTNTGGAPAKGFVLTDPLPPGASFVDASNGGTPGNGPPPDVSWDLGDLPPGASVSVTVTVKLPGPGTYDNAPAGTYTDGGNPKTVTGDPAVVTVTAPRVVVVTDGPRTTWSPLVTYTIDYRNDGQAPVTGVSLKNPIPAGASVVSATSGGAAMAGSVLWLLPDLKAGDRGQQQVTFLLPAPGTYRDTPVAAFTAAGAPSTTQGNTVETLYTTAPLTLTATAPAVTTDPNVTFQVTYENRGSLPATGLTLVDQLPPGVTFVSASSGGTAAGRTVSWALPDVPPGAAGSVSVTVTLNASGLFTNQADADFTVAGTAQVATSNATDTRYATTALTLGADGPTTTADPLVTYAFRWANPGNAAASAVTLTAPLPAGTTFVAASSGGALSGSTVTWSLGDLPAGNAGSVVMTVRLPQPGRYSARATATPKNGNAVDSNVITTTYAAPTLALTAIAPDVTQYPQVTFTLAWSNPGAAAVQGATLLDELPPGAAFVSATSNGTNTGGVVSWSLGTLAPGASGTVSIVATLATPGDYLNLGTATFTSDGVARQIASNTTTTRYLGPGVVVALAAPGETTDGLVPYTITVTNTALVPATGASLTEPLPAGAQIVSASNGGTVMNGGVVWTLGDLPPGASQTETVTIRLPQPGTYVATATAVYTVGGKLQSAASAPVTTVFAAPGVTVVASAPETTFDPTVTFTLAYANGGAGTASGVKLGDLLPPGAQYVSSTNNGAPTGGSVVWSLPDLKPGDGGKVSVTVKLPAFGTYLNQGAATYTAGALAQEAPSNVTRTLYAVPLVELTATAPSVTTVPDVTFGIDYVNLSSTAADNVVVTDKLPPGVTFVSATGNGQNAGGVVTWSLGKLAPGQMGSVSVMVTLGSFGTYSNSASAAFTVGNLAQVTTSNGTTTIYQSMGVDGGVDMTGGAPDMVVNPCLGKVCPPAMPVCDPMSGQCRGCQGDNECGGLTPACEPDGTCGQCSQTNQKQCVGSTPICDVARYMCATCVPGGDASACAKSPDGPVCERLGLDGVFCGCDKDSDCGDQTSGRICDLLVHRCAPGCSGSPTRNHCPQVPTPLFCTNQDVTGATTGQCTAACQVDGDCRSTVPSKPLCLVAMAPAMNACVQCRVDADCAGQPQGRSFCDPTSHACGQCVSGASNAGMMCSGNAAGAACLPDDNCGCNKDSDCGAVDSGRACDDRVHTCVPGCRGTGGNHCPAGESCSSADTSLGTCNLPDGGVGDGGTIHYVLSGGGCDVGPRRSGSAPILLVGLIALALGLRRRRPER